MDSLTQIVLGASVGEAVLGKKVGNRAPLWGAIAGTIPDLDVIANLWQSEYAALLTHRTFTHSLLFCLIAPPLLGLLIHKLYRGQQASWKGWSWLSFWAFSTHILLDCGTTWGTMVFYPFSEYRVAFNNVSVVDPLYTLPFLALLLVAILHRDPKARQRWNTLALIVSSAYMLFTFANKATVNHLVEETLHEGGLGTVRYSTYPTFMNNFLWYVTVDAGISITQAITRCWERTSCSSNPFPSSMNCWGIPSIIAFSAASKTSAKATFGSKEKAASCTGKTLGSAMPTLT
jgi:inner membrane protein